ncbi:MAG: TIGR01244 family sulfur transferase [Sphingomonadaceae bacterium]
MADIRPLSEAFAAAPQILPEDMAELAAAGFRHVVNNRPDSEVPAELQGEAMAAAAKAAGLGYTAIPVDHSGLSPAQVDQLRAVLAGAGGKVLGYCRSGTRSTMLWALAEAARGTSPDTITRAAAAAGYDVRSLLPLMQKLAPGR